jgi:glucose/arabinose dehydrogenase
MELTSRERKILAAIEQHVSEEAPRLARLTDDREVDFRLVRHGRRVVSIVAAEAEGRGQGGLLGLAVSPTFDADPLVYVYFSTTTENRIERMTFDGTAFGPREPLVTGIPSAVSHNGGALEFGPDGMLYAGAGDATDGPLAQDPASLAGKILRMSPDGTSAPGNPFPGSIVYSLGHRNVQGLAFDSLDRLWASEFGITGVATQPSRASATWNQTIRSVGHLFPSL